jgi:uncharacterized membrane protein YphA (DoxX/SURF4 family)/peroxiredoxin
LGLALAARIVLAAVFVLAGAAKLADLEGSRRAMEGFGVPRRFAAAAGPVLPVIELGAAVALLAPRSAWWGAVGAAALLALFIVGIAFSLARGEAPDCHCFGQLHSAPAGPWTLTRNGVLAALAASVIARGPGASELSPVGWIDRLTPPELVLVCLVACLIVVVAAQGWFLLELFRQNGRILSRLDAMERGLAMRGSGPASPNGNGRLDGLPVGAPAPDFELPAVGGGSLSLRSLLDRRRPVLLVFSDPRCGPCEAVLPEVAEWQGRHDDVLSVVVVSRGDERENSAMAEKHRLSHVLVQSDREVAQSYRTLATPSAALVSAEGRIAQANAVGEGRIRELVAEAIRVKELSVHA